MKKKSKEEWEKDKITKHLKWMKKSLKDGKLSGVFLGEGKVRRKKDEH